MRVKKNINAARVSAVAAGLAAALVLGTGDASAAEATIKAAEVPAAVMAEVRRRYAGADLQRYEREEEKGQVRYEVTLRQGKRHLEVKLTPEGKLLAEEEQVEERTLTAAVRKGLGGSAYRGWRVKQVERVTDHEAGGRIYFEIEVMQGNKVRELRFDPEGKLLSEEEDRDGG